MRPHGGPPATRFVHTDLGYLAYQVFGSGERDRAALPLIQVPTLVVARRDAQFHRVAYSQYLAQHITGAQLRVLDGADTLPFHAGDVAPLLDAVEHFVAGRHDRPTRNRVLATVLFTDIVGSTTTATSIGDQRWVDLLAEHERIVRAQLERYAGREVKMTGDGCLATFDGPTRAVACADAIVSELARVGLTVRAGVHTGEVEMSDGDIGGVAVHIASRVMACAEGMRAGLEHRPGPGGRIEPVVPGGRHRRPPWDPGPVALLRARQRTVVGLRRTQACGPERAVGAGWCKGGRRLPLEHALAVMEDHARWRRPRAPSAHASARRRAREVAPWISGRCRPRRPAWRPLRATRR